MTVYGAILTYEHRIAIGASLSGVSRDEYRRHVENGEKWCGNHHGWHPRTVEFFYSRATKPDGLDSVCRETVKTRLREHMRRLAARKRAARGAA